MGSAHTVQRRAVTAPPGENNGWYRLDSWSAPPLEQLPYSLGTRLLDTYHGWRDGYLGIPLVEAEQTAADPDQLLESEFGEFAIVPPGPIETPWTLGLYRQGELQIDDEWITHHCESAELTSQFMAAVTRTASLSGALTQAARRLEEASTPADPASLDVRRPAEEGLRKRSDQLVRARRLADHDRHLRSMQAAHHRVYVAFGESMLEMLVLGDRLARRALVTKARVYRIEDHTWRRISTYWRKLVRVHDDGSLLNARLAPLGPRMPRWARDRNDRDQLE